MKAPTQTIDQKEGGKRIAELKRVSISQVEEMLDVAEKDQTKAEEVYLKIREWRK